MAADAARRNSRDNAGGSMSTSASPLARYPMLYRSVALAIVIFWLVMTSLLVRNEINPEGSKVREVPTSLVMKMVFLHGQSSALRVFAAQKPIGYLHFQPRVDAATGDRLLEFNGNLQVEFGESRNRISWDGTMTMSPEYEVRRSKWGFAVRDPGFFRIELQTDAAKPLAHLVMRSETQVIDERDVALSQTGLMGIMPQFGASPEMMLMVQQTASQAKAKAPPTIRARQSSIRYRGERTETYLVTIEQEGQTLLQCHFSQLGQVLEATTFLGYSLKQEDLLP